MCHGAIRLLSRGRLRGERGDSVRVGLDDDILHNLLFFGIEDFGQGFVKLGLVLLELCSLRGRKGRRLALWY